MLTDYGPNKTKMLSAFHLIDRSSVAEGGLPMMPARRQFLRLTMAAATLPLISHIVRAQAYPNLSSGWFERPQHLCRRLVDGQSNHGTGIGFFRL